MTLQGDWFKHTFSEINEPSARVQGARFEKCSFEKCVFTGARFTESTFTDCVFDGCELSMIRVDGSTFQGVRFVNCRAMGIHWNAAAPMTFSVRFEKSRLDNSVFAGLKLKSLVVEESTANGVDWSKCDLTGAKFPRSDLRGAILTGAVIRKAEFLDAEGFRFDSSSKAGQTKVNLATAAQALADLGLLVPELDHLLGR